MCGADPQASGRAPALTHRIREAEHREAEHRRRGPKHVASEAESRATDPNHRARGPGHRVPDPEQRVPGPEHVARHPDDLAQDPDDLAQDPNDLAQDPEDLAQDPEDLAQDPEDVARGPEYRVPGARARRFSAVGRVPGMISVGRHAEISLHPRARFQPSSFVLALAMKARTRSGASSSSGGDEIIASLSDLLQEKEGVRNAPRQEGHPARIPQLPATARSPYALPLVFRGAGDDRTPPLLRRRHGDARRGGP